MKFQDLYIKKYAIRYRRLLSCRSLAIKIRKILLSNILFIFCLVLYCLDSQKTNIDIYFNLFVSFFIVIGIIYFFKMDHFFANKLAFKIKN